jgi:exodeoxyribonuclease VII large subunit
LEAKLAHYLRYQLLHARQRLTELLADRGWRHLEGRLREQAQRADELATRLRQVLRDSVTAADRRWALAAARMASFDLRGVVKRERLRLESLTGQLNQLSPARVLDRGYAIVFDAKGEIVKSAAAVRLGDPIRVQLARGRLEAEIKKKQKT